MSGSPFTKLGFLLLATPAVWRAAWRARWVRSLPLDQATAAIRAVPRWRWRWIDNPAWLAGSVDRWLPLLPPRGYGPCFRRSLILLDLWSRCGLSPTLRLGMLKNGEERQFHAWVEAEGISAGATQQWAEIWAEE